MDYVDGMNSLLKLFNNEEEFVGHFIENVLFFPPNIVNMQVKDVLNKVTHGSKIPVRYSRRFKEIYATNSEVDKTYLFNINNKDEAVIISNRCLLFHKDVEVNVIVDADGNRYVREAIKEYTGNVVSQGVGSNIFNYTISHIWGNTDNPYFFSLLWNVALIPTYLAFILDKPDNNKIIKEIKVLMKAICIKLYNPNLLMNRKMITEDIDEKYLIIAESLIKANMIKFIQKNNDVKIKLKTAVSELFKHSDKNENKFINGNIGIFKKSKYNSNETKDKSQTDSQEVSVRLKKLENKSFIFTALSLLKDNNSLEGVITCFTNKEFCKDNFELQFELLREITSNLADKEVRELYNDKSGYPRYYKKDIFIYKDKNYLVCNHWYDIQRDKFIQWVTQALRKN